MKLLLIIMLCSFGLLFMGCNNSSISVFDNENMTVSTNLFGVPDTFTGETANQEPFNILKGGVNNMRLRPEIGNEHAESSREVKSIVTTTNSVGQIFRASQDNINSIYLTVESALAVVVDTFESYNDGAELQAVWVSNEVNRLAELETVIVKDGTQSMRLDVGTVDTEWVNTFPTSVDLTSFTGSFDLRFTAPYSGLKISVFITDGTNSKSADLVFNNIDTWIAFDVTETNLVEDQVATTDVTAITGMGFRVTDRDRNEFVYVDNIRRTPPGGKLGITLWDMGATKPVSGVTSLDDGTQYTQIGDITDTEPTSEYVLDLDGGKRLYHLHYFAAGVALEIPGNEILNVNNYYALVLNYVDAPVAIYGPNFDIDYYSSGYAFNATNNSTPIVQLSETDDLAFTIFSTQDVYLTQSVAFSNADPGMYANYMSSIEDGNMTTTSIIISHGVYVGRQGTVFFNNRPLYLPKGGKFNLDYNDDPLDEVNRIIFGMRYLYEPQPVWG